MNHSKRFIGFVFGILIIVGFVLSGCTKTKPDSTPKNPTCDLKGKLTQEIAAEAKVAEISCFHKRWDGAETLHFKVSVTNTSTVPQRFRVNIFLENGKAVGGLIPRKTKKGLVAPGDTASFTYPVKGMPGEPGDVTLIVKPISK